MIDLLIRNAKIIDGSGSKGYTADVAVDHGIIKEIGTIGDIQAGEIIDGRGKYLTPGFIDIHRHGDIQAFNPEFGPAELCQGITTCISGNCGMSAAPCTAERKLELLNYLEPCLGKALTGTFPAFSDYTRQMESISLPLNMGAYVGNGAIRIAVKGFDPSPMNLLEMDTAKAYVAEAVESGAMGLSMGIMYAPECCYSMDELVQLAKQAGKRGGILTTHIRGEGDSLVDSVAEVVEIARQAEIPLNISHFKAAGRSNWGNKLDQAIELMERARGEGQDITCDVYPYEAGSTMLSTLIPPSFLADGMDEALKRLENQQERKRLGLELAKPHDKWDNLLLSLGWDCVVISSVNHRENESLIGRSIGQIARDTGKDEVDCLCDILLSEQGKAGMVIFSMSIDDVIKVMTLPYSMIISDSIYPPFGKPHPRLYGAFSRVISHYVQKLGILNLETAVKKMTFLPAVRMGLRKRGLVQTGYTADMLLFDGHKVLDRATYQDPVQLAQGMDYVFIRGDAVLRNGKPTGDKKGIFIRKEV